MNILFLSVSAGGGHMKAAEALKSYIEEKYPESRTMVLDSLKYINPILDKLIIGSYINTLKTTPKIYGKLYEIAETGDNLSEVSQNVNKILSYKIKRLIREFIPDLVVCTHPFPLQMATNLKKQGKIKTKIAAVLTDFIPHPFWLHDEVDAYIVAHSGMKFEMINKGIKEEIIYPLGIPVSKNFTQPLDKSQMRKELDLKDIPTVLIMGGSLGFGQMKDTFLTFLNTPKVLQLVVVTGKNTKLMRQVKKYSALSPKSVKIFGYTDKISELMSASDLIVTKPGGLTVSESLIKQLPMILISPIPGQEENNARFLQNSGVAARIYPKQNVEEVLYQLLDNPLRIRHMKEMAQHLARPNACEDIVKLFNDIIEM
jgi:processive 1,2-diacylglycerol beta-glucosyltransferase